MLRLLLFLLTWPGLALAAEPGERLAAPCQGCHGAAGPGGGGFPALAGTHSAADFAAIMRDFRADAREGTVMGRIARGYTDTEIAALAAWFARPN